MCEVYEVRERIVHSVTRGNFRKLTDDGDEWFGEIRHHEPGHKGPCQPYLRV